MKEKDFYSGNFQDKKIYDYPINKETMRSQYNETEIQIIEKELSKSNLEELSKSKNYYDYVKVLAGKYLSEKFFTKYLQKSFGV